MSGASLTLRQASVTAAQTAVKKGLQGIKDRQNMPAERLAELDAAEAAEMMDRRVAAAESLAENAQRLADSNVALVAMGNRVATALETFQRQYELVVCSLKSVRDSWLI